MYFSRVSAKKFLGVFLGFFSRVSAKKFFRGIFGRGGVSVDKNGANPPPLYLRPKIQIFDREGGGVARVSVVRVFSRVSAKVF